jgi:hypothetical protein
LACLRNPYNAATTVGCVDDLKLSDQGRAILFQQRFTIRPDESHLAKNNSARAASFCEGIEGMNRKPDYVAVLFGVPNRPYMNPYHRISSRSITRTIVRLVRPSAFGGRYAKVNGE